MTITKKALRLAVCLTALLCVTPTSAENLKLPNGLDKFSVSYKSVCIGGYLFAIAYSKYGIELTQVYRDGGGALASPQPMKCDT